MYLTCVFSLYLIICLTITISNLPVMIPDSFFLKRSSFKCKNKWPIMGFFLYMLQVLFVFFQLVYTPFCRKMRSCSKDIRRQMKLPDVCGGTKDTRWLDETGAMMVGNFKLLQLHPIRASIF